ncbi:hypothetical protein ACJX0J_006564, partial [Zea mays]
MKLGLSLSPIYPQTRSTYNPFTLVTSGDIYMLASFCDEQLQQGELYGASWTENV